MYLGFNKIVTATIIYKEPNVSVFFKSGNFLFHLSFQWIFLIDECLSFKRWFGKPYSFHLKTVSSIPRTSRLLYPSAHSSQEKGSWVKGAWVRDTVMSCIEVTHQLRSHSSGQTSAAWLKPTGKWNTGYDRDNRECDYAQEAGNRALLSV